MAGMAKDDYIDVTGTLRKAQRQIETERTKTGLRSLRALEPDELRLPERLRFYYLRGLAHLQRLDAARAMPDLDRALSLAHQLHNAEALTRTANLVGWAHRQQGRPAMALEYHRRAYHAAQEGATNDPEFQALVATDLATDYLALGDYPHANDLYREAARRFESKAGPARMARIYWGLALTNFRMGDLPQARTHALRALELYEAESTQGDPARRTQSTHMLAQAHINYALILMALDSLDEAARQLRAAAEAGDDLPIQTIVHRLLAEIALKRGQTAEAATEAGAAVETARRSKQARPLGQALELAARVAVAGGEIDAALAHYQHAVAALEGTPHRSLLGEVLFNQARLLYQHQREADAMRAYEQAYRLAGAGAGPNQAHLLTPPDQPGYTRQPATSRERRQARSPRSTEPAPSADAPPGNGAHAPAARRP